MRRVSVVGNSGSGKSTLARAIASRLDVPHIELDALHHQPGWLPAPPERVSEAVAAAVETDGWVVDGNYAGAVQGMVWARADTVVWLDLPRPLVMWQVATRTLRRIVGREVLWNGNRERWGNLFTLDPEESVIVWAWTRHRQYRERYLAAMGDAAWAHLRFERIRSRADGRRLLLSL